ncbi:hypothetical protein QBC34DRAFT_462417, partial [Podospora aff. communis PSN243]
MESWTHQRVYEAAEAKKAALERAGTALREKDIAVRHAAEAEQKKALVEEQAQRAERNMSEAVELAKDSAYRAQKAERDLAAEVERARDAEHELLRQLKLALVRQQELETERSMTAHQAAVKREENASAAAELASRPKRSAAQGQGT